MTRRFCTTNPKAYLALTNYGYILGRVGKYNEAIEALKKAVEVEPNRPEALTNLGSMYQTAGKLNEAIDAYTKVLKMGGVPGTGGTNLRDLVKILTEQRDQQNAVSKGVSPDEMQNDYFAFAKQDGVAKWLPSSMPVKVYIPSDAEVGKIQGFRPEFNTAIRDSFADWERASAGKIKFQYVTNPTDANIQVTWTDDVTKVKRPAEGGEARVLFDEANGIRRATIILLTKSPDAINGFIPVNIIKFACLHEIGHSLGIMGHSPDPNDIMFCSIRALDAPPTVTARDAATLARVYDSDVKVARERALQSGDSKIALNAQAIELLKSGQYEQAAAKLEAAYKLDPSFDPVRENLGSCYINTGSHLARNGKYNEAIAKFKRALELVRNQNARSAAQQNLDYCMKLLKK
jgi:tetratricopeptide (TPR) repeat protein